MGAVYKAHDTQLDRTVALKIPKFDTSDGTMLERFNREAKAAATLSHSNICPVHDVGEIDGTPYISMGYIEGRSLSSFVNPDKPLSQKQAVQIVRKLTAGLNEAHSHGVIHRDLKPDNVMIDRKSNPVIMDFGLARRTTTNDIRVTQGGQMIGTPAYMSPEQVEGDVELMGPRSDIYSLGVILYELVTGRLPYQGSVASVLAQIMKAEPTPPAQFRSGLNPELQAICLKMMAANPDHRYATVAEANRDLTALLKGKPTSVRDSVTGVASQGIATGDEGISQLVAPDDHPLKDQLSGRSRSKASKFRPIQGILAAVAVVGLLAGYFLFVRVGDQTVRLKIDDPNAKVFVDGDEVRIVDLGATIQIKPGEHGVEVRRDDLIVMTRSLTVVNGDNPVLQLDVLEPDEPQSPSTKNSPAETAIATDGHQTDDTGHDQNIASASVRKAAEWAIESGISLGVETGGELSNIATLAELPADPIVVRRVTVGPQASVSASEWRNLSAFRDVTHLYLKGARFDDEAFRSVTLPSQLQLLDLTETRVTDSGLEHLVGLTELQILRITGKQGAPVDVTDAVAKTLQKLHTVNTLNMSVCRLTDAIVPQLAQMSSLKELYLYNNPITDAAIPPLKPLKLERLGLGSTKITDASAETLNEMASLNSLVLNYTDFSSDGLRNLESLTLDNLFLVGCSVTQDALDEWMSAHPQTQVEIEHGVQAVVSKNYQPATSVELKTPPVRTAEIPEAFAKSDDPLVQAVAWALSHRFEVTLISGDEAIKTTSFDAVPSVEYTVTGLAVHDAKDSTESDWRHLKALSPTLQELTVNDESFTDAAMVHLTAATKLERLTLESSKLTSAGFASLKKLPALVEVTIGSKGQSTGQTLDAKSIEHLAGIPNLQTVRLDGVPLQDEWLKPLSRVDGLRTLSLSSTGITDPGVGHFRGTKLMELDLSDNRLPDTVTLILTDIKPLTSVDLSGTDIGDPSCKQLLSLPRLRSLNLNRTKVTNLGMAELAKARKLQSLSLNETSISNAGLSSLTKLRLLRDLSIKLTQCSLAGVDDFRKKNDKCQLAYSPAEGTSPDSNPTFSATLPTFTTVSLDDEIPDAFKKSEVANVRTIGWLISRNVHPVIRYRTGSGITSRSISKYSDVPTVPFTMTSVNISQSSLVGKDDWGFLKGLSDVTSISCYLPAFNDDALKQLVGHPNLQGIYLRQSSVSDEGLKSLAGIPKLRSLTIAGNGGNSSLPEITDDGAPAISQIAGRLSSLTLDNTLISNAGLRQVVKNTVQLTSFTVSEGLINDEGLVALRGHPHISYLNVSGDEFSDALFAVAATLPSLSTLNLSECAITDAGLQRIAGHPRLSSVYLSDTGVTDNALFHLQKLPRLSSLSLSNTEVSDNSLKAIAGMPLLTYVSLEGSNVTVPAAQALQNARPRLRVYLQGVQRPSSN